MKKTRAESNILIYESRKLFKSLEDKLVYVEIDTSSNSILYTSGTEYKDAIFMMIEDVFTPKALQEYEKGLAYIISNSIDVYQSYLDSPLFINDEQVIKELWVIGLQPSEVIQFICNKTNIWKGLEEEILTLIQLPMAVFEDGKITTYNELFISYLIDFKNIVQNLNGRLFPLLIKRTQKEKYIIIFIVESTYCELVNNTTLLNNPSEFSKEDFSSLIKMEVEIKQMEIRIKQLEKFIYLEKNGIASRLKEIEVYQDQDNQKWLALESYKDTIENKVSSIVLLNTLIKNFPAGVKGFVVVITLLVFLFLTLIDIGIRRYGVKDTLNNIDHGIDIIQ